MRPPPAWCLDAPLHMSPKCLWTTVRLIVRLYLGWCKNLNCAGTTSTQVQGWSRSQAPLAFGLPGSGSCSLSETHSCCSAKYLGSAAAGPESCCPGSCRKDQSRRFLVLSSRISPSCALHPGEVWAPSSPPTTVLRVLHPKGCPHTPWDGEGVFNARCALSCQPCSC